METFICTVEGCTYSQNKHTLRADYVLRHQQVFHNLFECSKCSKVYKSKDEWDEHRQKRHSTLYKSYQQRGNDRAAKPNKNNKNIVSMLRQKGPPCKK